MQLIYVAILSKACLLLIENLVKSIKPQASLQTGVYSGG
jgi:hypothetical protein